MAVTALKRLQTREARKSLQAREEPYWHEIKRGLALGYHKGASGGSWRLREFRNGRYVKRLLGASDDDTPNADGITILTYQDALQRALGADRPTITRPGKYTVAEASESYFAQRQGGAAADRITYRTFISPAFGDQAIAEITTTEIERWRAHQVVEKPSRHDDDVDPRELLRAAQVTANRRFAVLRAILNHAFRTEPNSVPTDSAWRRVKPFKNVDRARDRTLSFTECKKLLKALPPAVQSLARASLLTGCRLGEVEALRASDIAGAVVHVRHSKSGKERRIPLSPEGAEFFRLQSRGKQPADRLFDPVHRVALSRAMRAACTEAKLTPAATFHDLRRSYGSLLINSGASADVIQELLGHADVRMTRRAYAHLMDATLSKAVTKHLPKFGVSRGKAS